jgi:hypothetical protein
VTTARSGRKFAIQFALHYVLHRSLSNRGKAMAIRTRDGSVKGTLYLYKRVPKRYASVEPRTFVWISLRTDSPSVAKTKEAATWEQMVAAWEAKLAGDTTDAEQRFAAARDLAEAQGFRYLRSDQVAKLPLDELRDRFAAVSAFKASPDSPDMLEAAAVLGGAKEPALTVSRALELYWTLAKDKTLGKSEDQLRRWKNPLKKAVKNFIAVVGDRAIQDISGDDMLDFRNWWMERLEEEDLTPNSGSVAQMALRDSSRESRVIAGGHEQTEHTDLQDAELARV